MTRFDSHRSRPSVVIECVICPSDSDKIIGESIEVLVKGMGLVERRQFVVRNDLTVLFSERVLVED